jgi:hypothetical protein
MQEIFETFEVNHESIWPVLGRLIGGSVLLHGVVIAVIMLFPPVRNALNVAALFSRGFVDRPYTPTEFGDNAELIAMTSERFRYPDGYWMVEEGMALPMVIPTPTPPPVIMMPAQHRVRAPRNFTPEVASPSPSPDSSPAIGTNAGKPSNSTSPQPSPGTNGLDAKADEKAQQALADAAKESGVDLPKEGEINKKPFKDLAVYADGLKNSGKLNMDQPFEIVIDTNLDEKGKLANFSVNRKGGDANLVGLSEKLVGAMNDSGVLFYLKALGEDNPNTKVVFTIKQEKDAITATVASEAASALSAHTLVNGFNAAIAYGIMNRRGKPEEPLLKNTKASQDGKKIIFNFNMPRQDVVDLIKNGIAEAQPTSSPS